ncbi:glycosyltransferase family 2 protein [Methanotorris formicicus]|uniref:Glycosyl transferase family 2 n=1 Tax=Methanotorris formicicus Mc-S-70 TaxID=647171 RepID=H1KZL6_9EURY|nr:glycosyltransferase family 2 protein [Methanotorris formicicus]EHP85757.1 glycosyl transferase family 2 [Methanotorris formicicus Mc-S-70]
MIAVIPMFNEERNILKVLKDLEELGIDAVVVDDGSEDNSINIVEEFSKKSKNNIYLIKKEKNEGKARALKDGTEFALKLNPEYIVYMDGDYQHKPKDIPKMIEKLKKGNADAVFGIRRYKYIPIHRQVSNFLASLIMSLVVTFYSGKIYIFKDIQCGYRIIKAKFLKNVYFGEGYSVEHLIALQLAKRKAKIIGEYVDIEYHPDATSYITTKKILDVVKEVAKFVLKGTPKNKVIFAISMLNAIKIIKSIIPPIQL